MDKNSKTNTTKERLGNKINNLKQDKQKLGIVLLVIFSLFLFSFLFLSFTANPFYLILLFTLIPFFGDLGTLIILTLAILFTLTYQLELLKIKRFSQRRWEKAILIFGLLYLLTTILIPLDPNVDYFGFVNFTEIYEATYINQYIDRWQDWTNWAGINIFLMGITFPTVYYITGGFIGFLAPLIISIGLIVFGLIYGLFQTNFNDLLYFLHLTRNKKINTTNKHTDNEDKNETKKISSDVDINTPTSEFENNINYKKDDFKKTKNSPYNEFSNKIKQKVTSANDDLRNKDIEYHKEKERLENFRREKIRQLEEERKKKLETNYKTPNNTKKEMDSTGGSNYINPNPNNDPSKPNYIDPQVEEEKAKMKALIDLGYLSPTQGDLRKKEAPKNIVNTFAEENIKEFSQNPQEYYDEIPELSSYADEIFENDLENHLLDATEEFHIALDKDYVGESTKEILIEDISEYSNIKHTNEYDVSKFDSKYEMQDQQDSIDDLPTKEFKRSLFRRNKKKINESSNSWENDEKIEDVVLEQQIDNTEKQDSQKTEEKTEEKTIETKKEITVEKEVLKKPERKSEKVISKTKEISNEKEDKDWAKDYELPSLSLLSNAQIIDSNLLQIEAQQKVTLLNDLFKNFNVSAEVKNYDVGPTVTVFKISIKAGIMISKITNLEDNIKLELSVKDVRIQSPIPGTSYIGIEVPNSTRIPVGFKETYIQTENPKGNLIVILGKDVFGKEMYLDLASAPHMLIAGSTGSGKSIAINTLLASLLLRYKPTELKLILIDPKMVEFTPFHSIPHLVTPVITNPNDANLALKAAVREMDERYKMMSQSGARNIEELNKLNRDNDKKEIPYLVVVIDELADLMMIASKDVEDSIRRITQKARAAGIHIVIATQRPSTDIITGVIKANIPSRIAFTVASSIDSRTILDATGAEKLVGAGDMMVSLYGKAPVRGQGSYISMNDIQNLTRFCKEQYKPIYSIDIKEEANIPGIGGSLMNENDPLYKAAKRIVMEQKKASTSLLQRYLNIGYNKAANLIDALESYGVIGPAKGSKAREVLIFEDEE